MILKLTTVHHEHAAHGPGRVIQRELFFQTATFESIDGIFLLDDLIGFLGDDDFRQFALPYLKRVFGCRDVSVRFLHNDAHGLVTARHLTDMGVNMFNFSYNHFLNKGV